MGKLVDILNKSLILGIGVSFVGTPAAALPMNAGIFENPIAVEKKKSEPVKKSILQEYELETRDSPIVRVAVEHPKYTPPFKLDIPHTDTDLYITAHKRVGTNRVRFIVEKDGDVRGVINSSLNVNFFDNHRCSIVYPSLLRSGQFVTLPTRSGNPPRLIGVVRKNKDKLLKDYTAPQFVIPRRDFLESNGFLNPDVLLALQSKESGLVYTIVNPKTGDKFRSNIWGTYNAVGKIGPLLEQGDNKLIVTATDYVGNSSSQEFNFRIGSVVEEVDGIDFVIAEVLRGDFEKNKEVYEAVADAVNTHNKWAVDKIDVDEVLVAYFPKGPRGAVSDQDRHIRNAWFGLRTGEIGFCSGFFGKEYAAEEAVSAVNHELGHKVFENLSNPVKYHVSKLFERAHRLKDFEQKCIFHVFKEGYYVLDVVAGHPHHLPHELFASSYHLYRFHRLELYRRLTRLSPESRAIADDLLEVLANVTQEGRKYR